jgi:beta-lactamase regulating signal transducer with metallopeptidase domain
MTQDLLWAYAFNLLVNSALTFLTVAAFVRLLMFILRVKQPRLKVLFLCIPILKLVVDPFLYDFHNWALPQEINPIEAEAGSRMISVMLGYPTSIKQLTPIKTGIQLSMDQGQTFTPADLAALSFDPTLIKIVVTIAGAISLILLSVWLLQVFKSLRTLSIIRRHATPCTRLVQNQPLLHRIKQYKVQVILSSAIPVPCAFGILQKYIYFPLLLVDKLSQEEFEAIVAHELNHLRWYDGIARMLADLIGVLFWWIPSRKWLNTLEHYQERACDEGVISYHISKLDLASAIVKATKTAKNYIAPRPLTCFVQKGLTGKRLRALLTDELTNLRSRKFKWIYICLIGLAIHSVLFGRFWIF